MDRNTNVLAAVTRPVACMRARASLARIPRLSDSAAESPLERRCGCVTRLLFD